LEPIVRESLEVMLRKINKEIALVEARLQRMAILALASGKN